MRSKMLAWTLLALVLLGLSFTSTAQEATEITGVVSSAEHESADAISR